MKVVLASQSPARLKLLKDAGITPIVAVSKVDEDAILTTLSEKPFAEQVIQLAKAKGKAIQAERNACENPEIIIAADSMLSINGLLQGKPHNTENVLARWQDMNGKSGELLTGHAVIIPPTTRSLLKLAPTTNLADCQYRLEELENESLIISACKSTKIHLATLTQDEITAYAQTGEPQKVAGALTIDGYGAPFVEAIEGDYQNVIGLSLTTLRGMLKTVGISWPQLWDQEVSS
ncbi:septum formation protein Maf [Boudabousia tangfeifanii]|uniref:Nucleoside triphosphate pyrophosphatase n=1 Tax=Boudabousia tangfeifanii TaxID=1912795 RepID=A0A1D9MMB9_9ACTO|nr:septum formation protein Maf [Boudabousia tangfeifanii]